MQPYADTQPTGKVWPRTPGRTCIGDDQWRVWAGPGVGRLSDDNWV
jgi:hypothetical protein